MKPAPVEPHTPGTIFNLPGDHRGESYLVHLQVQHGTPGNITRDYGVYFKPAPISFGLPEDLLYGAMLVMIFTALFFGQSSVGRERIVFAFEGWFTEQAAQDLGSDNAVGTALIIISGGGSGEHYATIQEEDTHDVIQDYAQSVYLRLSVAGAINAAGIYSVGGAREG